MIREALRPHPMMQELIDKHIQSMSGSRGYMALHARIEPDMQAHPVCRDKKVLNLTDIVRFIEEKWQDPPVAKVFMPINRQYLEKEGDYDALIKNPKQQKLINEGNKPELNWIAVNNLKELNRITREGMWNGQVPVVEVGSNMLKGTVFEAKWSTPGSMLNFYLGLAAKIFVGTEVSSYSMDLLANRFYSSSMDNYKYLPDGLHEWTPPGTIDAPGFTC